MENLGNYAKIAIIAFVGILVINKGLSAAGLSQYKA